MKMTAIFSIAMVGLILATAAPAAAQQATRVSNPEGLHLSRQDLQDLLVQLDRTAESAGGETGRHAQETAARIRQRLQEGDYRAGDRILLEVRQEPEMSGEFTVEPGRTITLPNAGSISLAGVLRSELEAHLRRELARFLQNPVVTARSLIRVAVMGEVGNPGFFTFPASLVLEDVVMEAGGPTRSANLDRIRIERAGETVWGGGALQQAMRDARTLDQLSLQAGDRIVVPSHGAPLWRTALTVISTAGTLFYLYTRIIR
jgi:protein involved in polysaccharide export with SLBB domain